METTPVTRAEFNARREVCDERFERDKERIETLEDSLKELTTLMTKLTGLVEQNTNSIADQEKRIRHMEGRPGSWLDKIGSAAVGVIVGYIINLIIQ